MPRKIRNTAQPKRNDPQTLPVVLPGQKPEHAVELYRWRCPMCGSMPSLEVTDQGGGKVMTVALSPFSLTIYLHELGGRGYSRYYYANEEDGGRWTDTRDALLRKLPEIERMLREMEPPTGPRQDKLKGERPYWNTEAKRQEERTQIDVEGTGEEPAGTPPGDTPPEQPSPKGPTILLPDQRVADRFNFRASVWARAILILSDPDIHEPVTMRWLKRSLGSAAESVVLELISQRVLLGASKDAAHYVINRVKLRQFIQGDISEMRKALVEEAASEAEAFVLRSLYAARGSRVPLAWFSAQPKLPAFAVGELIGRLERSGLLMLNPDGTWYVRLEEEQQAWLNRGEGKPIGPEPVVTPPEGATPPAPPPGPPLPPMDEDTRKEVQRELRRQAREAEGQRQFLQHQQNFHHYVIGLRADTVITAAEVQKRFAINSFATHHLLQIEEIAGYLRRIPGSQRFMRTELL